MNKGRQEAIERGEEWSEEPVTDEGSRDRNGWITFLNLLGWVSLVFGISGAIFIWVNYSNKSVLVSTYYDVTKDVIDPAFVAFGFAVMFQGLCVFALFLTLSKILIKLK